MAERKPFTHPPSTVTAQQQLALREAIAAGSPLHRDETVSQQPDTSVTARCEESRGAFIAIGDRTAADNLARHIADKHVPKNQTRAALSAREIEAAETLQRVVGMITGMVADGSLKSGQVINLARLASELGATRHYTQLAALQLIDTGTLRWSNATSTYARRVMVNHEVCRPSG